MQIRSDTSAELLRAIERSGAKPVLRTVSFYEPQSPGPEEEAEAERIGRRIIEHVVDTRTFLLGLDELYRKAMKGHEREELLVCAVRVARELGVGPADVPIEGYYHEEEALALYFRFMRALQRIPAGLQSRVERMEEYRRLAAIAGSPIYGRPGPPRGIFPGMTDPLADALEATEMREWAVDVLTRKAGELAREQGDFSLTGLAALAGDPVALAATRESMVLYDRIVFGRAINPDLPPLIVYRWRVHEEVARAAASFVAGFNELFGPELPPPEARYAASYFHAYDPDKVVGRCVVIGRSLDRPPQYYHWGIRKDARGGLQVEGFWDTRFWTTEQYMRKSRG